MRMGRAEIETLTNTPGAFALITGVAAVEYGIVTLIAVAVILAVNALAGNINSIFEHVATTFTN